MFQRYQLWVPLWTLRGFSYSQPVTPVLRNTGVGPALGFVREVGNGTEVHSQASAHNERGACECGEFSFGKSRIVGADPKGDRSPTGFVELGNKSAHRTGIRLKFVALPKFPTPYQLVRNARKNLTH
jgi:hypothetical protein